MKTINKLPLAALFVVVAMSQTPAQHVTGGISAGATFNSVKLENTTNHLTKKDNINGAEAGLFLHAPFGAFYLRPSVNAGFMKGTVSTYTDEAGAVDSEFKLTTLEIPVLAGLQLLPVLSFEAGPSWNYLMSWSKELNGATVSFDRHSFGYRAGARIHISSLEVFGHYGGMLNKNNSDRYLLSRPSRIIVGIALDLGSGN